MAQANTPYAAAPAFWLTALNVPCIDPPYSYLSAVDLNTGKLLWSHPFGTAKGSGALGISLPFEIEMGTPTHGASMITAGGLVFIAAAKDNMFRAYDLATGEEVTARVVDTKLAAFGEGRINLGIDVAAKLVHGVGRAGLDGRLEIGHGVRHARANVITEYLRGFLRTLPGSVDLRQHANLGDPKV